MLQRNSPALGPRRVRSPGQSWYLVPVLIIGGAPGAPARGNRGIRPWHPAQVAPGKPLPQAPIFQHHFGSISGPFSAPSWPPKSAPNRSKTHHKIHLKFHCVLVLVFCLFTPLLLPCYKPRSLILEGPCCDFGGFCILHKLLLHGYPPAMLTPFWPQLGPQHGSKIAPKSITKASIKIISTWTDLGSSFGPIWGAKMERKPARRNDRLWVIWFF